MFITILCVIVVILICYSRVKNYFIVVRFGKSLSQSAISTTQKRANITPRGIGISRLMGYVFLPLIFNILFLYFIGALLNMVVTRLYN